jgi:hypothetical protein
MVLADVYERFIGKGISCDISLTENERLADFSVERAVPSLCEAKLVVRSECVKIEDLRRRLVEPTTCASNARGTSALEA